MRSRIRGPENEGKVKHRPAKLTVTTAHIHHHRDGDVVLYQRPRSLVWQCRYRLLAGRWIRLSTVCIRQTHPRRHDTATTALPAARAVNYSVAGCQL